MCMFVWQTETLINRKGNRPLGMVLLLNLLCDARCLAIIYENVLGDCYCSGRVGRVLIFLCTLYMSSNGSVAASVLGSRLWGAVVSRLSAGCLSRCCGVSGNTAEGGGSSRSEDQKRRLVTAADSGRAGASPHQIARC